MKNWYIWLITKDKLILLKLENKSIENTKVYRDRVILNRENKMKS
jgi:hypothetical protein